MQQQKWAGISSWCAQREGREREGDESVSESKERYSEEPSACQGQVGRPKEKSWLCHCIDS